MAEEFFQCGFIVCGFCKGRGGVDELRQFVFYIDEVHDGGFIQDIFSCKGGTHHSVEQAASFAAGESVAEVVKGFEGWGGVWYGACFCHSIRFIVC